MNVQTMINTIKDNLGNRASGTIGSRSVDTVVLEALNLAVPHCVQEAHPDYYNRVATLNLVLGTREYQLPVVDTEGDAIRIKNIYGQRVVRDSGTDIQVKHLNFSEFIKVTPNYGLNYTGTPAFFALWGKNNTIHFDYFPSETYLMTLYVETFPNQIGADELSTELPIDEAWNIAVEAYATQHCYLKLQQTEMHTIWMNKYTLEKSSIQRMTDDKQAQGIDAQGHHMNVADPALNPSVGSWNS